MLLPSIRFLDYNRRKMLAEIDINTHNFSKIGKYISNKLHHIHPRDTSNKKQQTTVHQLSERKDRVKQEVSSSEEKKSRTVRKK